MSLTPVSPLITNWIENGLEWSWYWRPVQRPITIPANNQVQVPSGEYTFTAPEGTLLTFAGMFDHPQCGIRLESHPELDTGTVFTVANMTAIGFYNTSMYVMALVPPRTPPGIYEITQQHEWTWTDWARLYLVNNDSIDHRCMAYAYTMAMLREPRPVQKEAQ